MKKILLVEDDHSTREITTEIINSLVGDETPIKVIECESGERAIMEIIANPDVALIVTDINLGNMCGLDVVNFMRTSGVASWKEVPIILVSASHVAQSSLPKGCCYLKKPFQLDDLVDVVKHCLRHSINLVCYPNLRGIFPMIAQKVPDLTSL